MTKRILITGANGGFGKLTIEALLDAGHTVTGTMRDVKGRNAGHAANFRSRGAHVVEMDITKDPSVLEGVEEAIAEMGGLDVVINNAGLGVLGMQEHFTPEDLKYLFDVNVIGVHRVTRAALPLMRRRGTGLLVFVSSLLGRITMPFYGPYNASKWALEALAENYRTKLSGFGIESCIIEPGGYPTTFMDNLMKPSDTTRHESYGDFVHAPRNMINNFEQALQANEEQRPEKVAETILGIIDQPHGKRPFRTVIDNMGMGALVEDYNNKLDQITLGLYSNFGIEDMLEVSNSES
jgi:NAD(P)-dependent dehydrogenase (short-subunit alcohol dehydrogenase family)